MASSTASGHCDTIEKNTKEVLDHVFMNSFPPSSFPGKFQDFFAALNEDRDDLPSMLEDKLVPRKQEASNSDAKNRRRSKRAFQRHSSEVEVHLNRTSLTDSQGHSSNDGRKSPIPSRRRSSSIAVARPTPDLHRFRQAEAGPWGHLSPSPRSCTRTPTRTSMSPGAASGASSTHLSTGTSPGSPSPTSAAGPGNQATGSRCPGARQYRDRTSSMPAVPRHRRNHAETMRASVNGAEGGQTEDGVEYYRLRSFSITANGVYNLGDLFKNRRSRSTNSVTSSGTSCSGTREARLLSSVSQLSGMEGGGDTSSERIASYKVGMIGASGVGKTSLTAQFATSDYICAYDASLDEEYGQTIVSVMLNGEEIDLEIIDHPSAEMSVEAFCLTYNPDVYVVVYSVVDRLSLKEAEDTLLYLSKSEYMVNHGIILVGNKVDLERKREVLSIVGRRLANSCGCKFIETSSGLAHHVDELLVGVLAQIKLNPQRGGDEATRRRSNHRRRILKHLLGFTRKAKSCENLLVL